jgi:carboxyl-terminal processing protease
MTHPHNYRLAYHALWVVWWGVLIACSTPVAQHLNPTPTTQTQTETPTATATDNRLIATPTLAPLSASEREKMFDTLWDTVNNHYVYRDFRGVDWASVRTTYRDRVINAPDTTQFYVILKEMVDLLQDDHSRFDDPQDAALSDAIYNGEAGYAGIGIMIRELDSGLLVTRIAPDGPAAQAGIRPYDVITAIGSTLVTTTYTLGGTGYSSLIRGPIGSELTVTLQRSNDAPRQITLQRNAIAGDAFPEAVARILDHGIVLLTIDSFDRDSLADIVKDALNQASAQQQPAGLIIDIRENGGGSIDAMLNVVALFHDGGTIGDQVDRNNTYPLTVPTNHTFPPFDRLPIAVLTSQDTASASEMFTAGLRHLKKITVVGETTAGNSENLYPYDFDDGSVLWLAELLYRQPNGEYIENIGIVPDIVIIDGWDDVHPNQDTFITVATKALRP